MTEQAMGERSFDVMGMDCADCARAIEKGVGKLAGVQACRINFRGESGAVTDVDFSAINDGSKICIRRDLPRERHRDSRISARKFCVRP